MAIFNSYVKLPEGMQWKIPSEPKPQRSSLVTTNHKIWTSDNPIIVLFMINLMLRPLLFLIIIVLKKPVITQLLLFSWLMLLIVING